MRQAGLEPDKHSANAAVARWLREVANARVHGTTKEVPAERLLAEREKLQVLSAPYLGRAVRSVAAVSSHKAVRGYQHPLSVYQELMAGGIA
jgi:hypothetical protein